MCHNEMNCSVNFVGAGDPRCKVAIVMGCNKADNLPK